MRSVQTICPALFPSNPLCVPVLCSNSNLNLHPRLNIDDNLLDHLRRRIQIDQPLMNPHLIHIPRLAALSTGCFSSGDFEGFGG
jgi:hypothetical protein